MCHFYYLVFTQMLKIKYISYIYFSNIYLLFTHFADITCPSNQVYQLCGDPCLTTCSDISNKRKCSITECTEGCSCLPGEVWNEQSNTCVEQYKCPCYYNGYSYYYGHRSIQNNTNGVVDKW
jgi:hypothetical protein